MNKKYYIKNNIEKFFEKLYIYTCQEKTVYHISLGYLSSILMEGVKSLSTNSFQTVLTNQLALSRYENIITYLAIIVVLVFLLLKRILKKFFKDKTFDARFQEIFSRHSDELFSGHETEGIGWGLGKTVLCCPNINDGWKTSEIEFRVDNGVYDFSTLQRYDSSLRERDLKGEYETYLASEFSQKYTTDSDRFMLADRPTSMTDDFKVCIKLKKIKWSQLQFFWTKIITDERRRKKYIDDFYDSNRIFHPNSFCLHLVIITSDNKILITEISNNKPNDYAKAWAVSIGEQIDKVDFINQSDSARAWVERALDEELAILRDDFNSSEIHFLSVNLEGDIANFAFVCTVNLLIESTDIQHRIEGIGRKDNEFKRFEFLNYDDIPSEVLKDERTYHPSSKIRMLYAYIHARGFADLRTRMLKVYHEDN